jgi:alpha-methylacyl-CoA racemase
MIIIRTIETYRCKDGQYVAVGAIEAQFYKLLLGIMGLDKRKDLPHQMDQRKWPEMKEIFAKVFLTKTRDEWAHLADGTDACLSPVLSVEEATQHPHNLARNIFVPPADNTSRSSMEANPAPKLSSLPPQFVNSSLPNLGQHTLEVLAELGVPAEQSRVLLQNGVAVQANKSKL